MNELYGNSRGGTGQTKALELLFEFINYKFRLSVSYLLFRIMLICNYFGSVQTC